MLVDTVERTLLIRHLKALGKYISCAEKLSTSDLSNISFAASDISPIAYGPFSSLATRLKIAH